MAFIQSIIEFGLLLSIFSGQLYRPTIFGINFPIIDIFLILFSLFNIIQHLRPPQNKFLVMFLVYTWIGFIFFSVTGHLSLQPLFLLLRLTALLLLIIFPPSSFRFSKYFLIFYLSNLIFGFIQYFLWPDFTYFKALGWDDHLHRLVSTYFDPTFTGLIYLLILIYYIPRSSFVSLLFYFGLLLTYSRSTFLSLIFAIIYLFFKNKQWKLIILSISIIMFSVALLPRRGGEGNMLERTSSIYAKKSNLSEGIHLFFKHPLFGIGYNNIMFFKQSPVQDHSLNGFDSSLLNIGVTTGTIGLILFLFGIWKFFKSSPTLIQSLIIAILIHSLFANSLLYPSVFLTLILLRYRK